MIFRSSSSLPFVAFIIGIVLGIASSAPRCQISNLTKCLAMLPGLEVDELREGCSAITNTKGCLQKLVDGQRCRQEIVKAIEANMGPIITMENACIKALKSAAVECTANGIIKCSKPVKKAQDGKLTKVLLCFAWKLTKPCLKDIGKTCEKKKKWISVSAKVAVKSFDIVAELC